MWLQDGCDDDDDDDYDYEAVSLCLSEISQFKSSKSGYWQQSDSDWVVTLIGNGTDRGLSAQVGLFGLKVGSCLNLYNSGAVTISWGVLYAPGKNTQNKHTRECTKFNGTKAIGWKKRELSSLWAVQPTLIRRIYYDKSILN